MTPGRRVGTLHIDEDRVVHIAATRFGAELNMFCEGDNGELVFTYGGALDPAEYTPNCLTCVVNHGSQISRS